MAKKSIQIVDPKEDVTISALLRDRSLNRRTAETLWGRQCDYLGSTLIYG
jgi:hypothetical protein